MLILNAGKDKAICFHSSCCQTVDLSLPFISFFKTIILLWPCPLIHTTCRQAETTSHLITTNPIHPSPQSLLWGLKPHSAGTEKATNHIDYIYCFDSDIPSAGPFAEELFRYKRYKFPSYHQHICVFPTCCLTRRFLSISFEFEKST